MKLIHYFDTSLEDSDLKLRELFRLMGYGDHAPSVDILQIIDEMFTQLLTFCKPRCGYKICVGKRINKSRIEVEGIILNPGTIISSAMREAEYIIVFTATLGNDFDEWLKYIQQKDNIMLDFVASSLGSILAESVVNRLLNTLSVEVSRYGMKISNNYSPGYCSWLLAEQQLLFSVLPYGITGIVLTDSSLMIPIKSISGIVAIGREVKKRPYGCSVCEMKKKCNMSAY